MWNLLNILVPSSKILTLKSPCKSAFQNKLFADVSDPSGYSFPSGPWNYVVLYTNCQTTKKRRQMLEMIRAEMSSVIRMIPSHLLSWSVICKIKCIDVYWMSSTIPHFKPIETIHILYVSVIWKMKYMLFAGREVRFGKKMSQRSWVRTEAAAFPNTFFAMKENCWKRRESWKISRGPYVGSGWENPDLWSVRN